MPIVISYKSRRIYYIGSEDVLSEVLGHSDFDGEDWAIGDKLVFEDGTQSVIELEKDDLFHIWQDPVMADLQSTQTEINEFVGAAESGPHFQCKNWNELFAAVREYQEAGPKGCFIVGMAVFACLLFAEIIAIG